MKVGLRYDMRAPDLGPSSPSTPALYSAAVEQCAWADANGYNSVLIAEHHGAEDNYCPSPMILASAIAARTERIQIHLSALCLPMHHPLRLAEDLAVLDLVAGEGRVKVTAGLGYRPHEFAMFGVAFDDRAAVYEEILDVLALAWTGEPFEFRGIEVRVTPRPATAGGPEIFLAGSAKPSARRAASRGLGYRPASKELYEYYEKQCAESGRPSPEPFPEHGPAFLHVTDDPERALALLAPHLVHASNMYAQWATERTNSPANGYWKEQDGIESIRNDPGMWIVTPAEAIERLRRMPTDYEVRMHPLLGGIHPDLSWQSLEMFQAEVFPALTISQEV